MKFNCDAIGDRLHARELRQRKWHDWFAWYPVRIEHGDCRWLETVERQIKVERFDQFLLGPVVYKRYRAKNG